LIERGKRILSRRKPVQPWFCLHLVIWWAPHIIPHPLIPSPARDIGNNPQIFIAGEGSSEERGLRPLSISLPLLNKQRLSTI